MIDSILNRRCRECDAIYPLTSEFFYYTNGSPIFKCKNCIKKRSNDKERLYEYYNKDPIKERSKRIIRQMLKTVEEDTLPFDKDITNEYIRELLSQNTHCECCDVRFDYTCYLDEGKNPKAPSIDKIFPKRGYIKTNLAVLCWECNRIKRNATLQELETVYKWLSGVEPEVRARVGH